MKTQIKVPPVGKILYLSKSNIVALGGNSSNLYMKALDRVFQLHALSKFVQPLKPYLRWYGENGHIANRIIAMPAYIGGENPVAGLKWIGSKHSNPSQHNIERASALIILNDTETHYPVAILEGSLISGMRTAAVTAIAARYLALNNFRHVTCIGCGPIAKMQLTTLLEQFSSISSIYLFDIHPPAAEALIADLRQNFTHIKFQICQTAEEAVGQGEVVITCTVTDKPYIPYAWLKKGTFVSNVSIMDVYKDVFLQVDKVVVDDWEQCNREKKVINQLVLEGRFSREKLHAELGEIVIGKRAGRESNEEIILLNPMGMAIEDISCSQAIYQKAITEQVGTWLSLN